MRLPYYCVFENGQSIPVEPNTFRLHDTFAEFQENPRVFTSIGLRNDRGQRQIVGLPLHFTRLLMDARAFDLYDGPHLDGDFLISRLKDVLQGLESDRIPLSVRFAVSRRDVRMHLDRFTRRWPASEAIALRTFIGSRIYPEQKTTATEVCRRSQAVAEANQAQEALLIGSDGTILEGSWSNIFWFDHAGALFTREGNILPGVTRNILIKECEVRFASPSLSELLRDASEIFITQSLHGVSPIGSIDGTRIGSGAPGRFTTRLLEELPRIFNKYLTVLP